MNIYVLQTGSTLVSSAVPDRSSHRWSQAYTDLFQRRSDRISVPVKAFLVETAGHRVLVDTGWSAECATHPIRHLGFGLWFASEPVMTEDEAVPAQLARHGLAPSDLDAIVLTHLDCDHASGLVPLKDAQRIYCSEEEWRHAHGVSTNEKTSYEINPTSGVRRLPIFARDVRYRSQFWEGVHMETLPMKDDPTAPFFKSCDLFGDGSVRVVLTPGHSEGSVAVLAQGGTGYAAFVGDDSYNRHSWEEQKLPGPLYNAEDMRRTLAWVKALSQDPKCIGIYAAHDPEGPVGGCDL